MQRQRQPAPAGLEDVRASARDNLDAFISARGAAERELGHLEAQAGSLVRRIRQSVGITLAELARRADISAPYLSDAERGRRNMPERAMLRLLDMLDERAP